MITGNRPPISFRPFGALVLLLAACGSPTGPGGNGTELVLSLQGLAPLDPVVEGRYEAWLVLPSGHRQGAGTFSPSGAVILPVSVTDAVALEITIERPDEGDPAPSEQVLLRGDFAGSRADLTVDGAVTQRPQLTLQREPGQFTMFSPSDNGENGYPSHEESGIWLFNMAPRDTPQNDMWVRLTPLGAGWTYEGWMVRDYGTPQAIWLSYGKFLPDQTGAVNRRDDTGWGPFSGVVEFQSAGEEEFPGDDWISNPLQLPFPAGLALPLDLREKDAAGRLRWTHVITIEPAWDRGEPVTTERPFLVRPYRDRFGDGPPGAPRTITFHDDGVPRGTAIMR